MGILLSKTIKKWKHENQNPQPRVEYVTSSSARQRYFNQCVPLYKAALKGDWEAAHRLLREDSTLVKTGITKGGETALHIAALEGHAYFVDNLLKGMEASDLEIQNGNRSTALCLAAAAGHMNIVELMVEKNRELPKVHGEEVFTPLYMAVLQGHKKMAEDLYPLSDFRSWTKEDQTELLTTCIHSGLYDLAVTIVKQYETLALAEDSNGEKPLEVLASKPSAFCGTSQRGLWGSIVGMILSSMKLKACNASAPSNAYTLFDCLLNIVISQEDIETAQVPGSLSNLLFIAAESGNDNFLIELIGRDPNLIYEVNNSRHSIFHIAVLHRYVKVFNLIYEQRVVKDFILSTIDKDNNNILHLAAKLSPQYQLNDIPGAGLQMQREVMWYKVVEKMVQPSYRTMKNSAGQTPYDLFLTEHQNLMKEGEKQMKQIAKSFMLVTTLIATVVFTTAFTVPGGYNNTGPPILQNKMLFVAFPLSEAIATLASLTSILMFLSVLTSRYSDNDFLRWLPFWLVVGVAALFVSIVAMMAAFCIYLLSHEHGVAVVTVVLVFFASVPVMSLILKCPLLITTIRCTYGSKWLFRSNNQLYF